MAWYQRYAQENQDDETIIICKKNDDGQIQINYKTESCGPSYPSGYNLFLKNGFLDMIIYDTYKPFTNMHLKAYIWFDTKITSNIYLLGTKCTASSPNGLYTFTSQDIINDPINEKLITSSNISYIFLFESEL